MGCACEDGSRDSFIGVIKLVLGKADFATMIEKLIPGMKGFESVSASLKKLLKEAPPDRWGLMVRVEDGSQMSMSGDLLPQTQEWMRARIGKKMRFTVIQLPRKGGTSWGVAELL